MVELRSSFRFSITSITSIASLITSSVAGPIPTPLAPSNATSSTIIFFPCPAELGFPEVLECGTLSVPVNWDAPDAEQFDLGLVRLPAPSNSSTYIGPLFINPGGPGGRASELVAQLAGGTFGDGGFTNAFDVIGLDPRGVGLSSQVECDMQIFRERVTLFPQTQEEYDRLVDKNKRFAQSCRDKSGALFEHVDTISVAKDHEAVRVALGNQPFNYVGESYGSQLGAQYAQLFPDNIRTLVLDGMLQHSQSDASNLLIESSSYSLGLYHFFEWASTNESSPLNGQDVEQVWFDLLNKAQETPIPALSCNGTDCNTDVNAEEILFNAQGGLIRASPDVNLGRSWGALALAIVNATEGDASMFSTRFDDPSMVSFLAIGCLDWTHESTKTLAGVLAQKDMANLMTPLTQGASQTWQLLHACLGWPIPVKNPPQQLSINTPNTILLVNSDSDPSTGYPWAVGMLEEIENKSFVTRVGDGHTSFVLGGETTNVILEYLITGQAPKNGLVTYS